MNVKKYLRMISSMLILVFALTSCTPLTSRTETNGDPKAGMTNKEDGQPQAASEQKYVEDNTTEVLIEAEINPKDIVRSYQHGDHWHVFTKDGKEHIVYVDPKKLIEGSAKLQLVSVVGLDKLKNLDIVEIRIHGDHYHVYSKDGTEYITYENPSPLFPHLKVLKYEGSHGDHKKAPNLSLTREANGKAIQRGDSKEEKGSKAQQEDLDDPNRIVRILVHDDHWHIYDAAGNEYVVFSDPRSLYPNASYGVYTGSHAPLNGKPKGSTKPQSSSKPQSDNDSHSDEPSLSGESSSSSYPHSSDSSSGLTNDAGLKLITPPFHAKRASVIHEESKLRRLDVTLVLKHDDHYHIYTRDQNEYITFENELNAFEIFPRVQHGLYHGSHGASTPNLLNPGTKVLTKEEASKVKANMYAWLHGDHWHLHDKDKKGIGIEYYIDAEGLQAKYPGIVILPFTLPSEAQEWENEGKYDGIKVDTNEEFYKKQAFLAKHYGVYKGKVRRDADKLNVEIDTDDGYITLPLSSLEIGTDGEVKIVKPLPPSKKPSNEPQAENPDSKPSTTKYVQPEFKEEKPTNHSPSAAPDESKNEPDSSVASTAPTKPKKPTVNYEDKQRKEDEIKKKLASKLGLSEDQIEDKILDILFENDELEGVSLGDFTVNDDGTVSYGGKKYKLQNEDSTDAREGAEDKERDDSADESRDDSADESRDDSTDDKSRDDESRDDARGHSADSSVSEKATSQPSADTSEDNQTTSGPSAGTEPTTTTTAAPVAKNTEQPQETETA